MTTKAEKTWIADLFLLLKLNNIPVPKYLKNEVLKDRELRAQLQDLYHSKMMTIMFGKNWDTESASRNASGGLRLSHNVVINDWLKG